MAHLPDVLEVVWPHILVLRGPEPQRSQRGARARQQWGSLHYMTDMHRRCRRGGVARRAALCTLSARPVGARSAELGASLLQTASHGPWRVLRAVLPARTTPPGPHALLLTLAPRALAPMASQLVPQLRAPAGSRRAPRRPRPAAAPGPRRARPSAGQATAVPFRQIACLPHTAGCTSSQDMHRSAPQLAHQHRAH